MATNADADAVDVPEDDDVDFMDALVRVPIHSCVCPPELILNG